ncbi:hypothetical protein COU76_01290 [Candidatus Peregrinibacteria bacterium CG10_big_fil_rev_8_21_14_0_10_49_10]|nr:MAG: hypothetical protein COU76_01290 [Candidatus Peregrinibacteria bacterium CG10_big_fil_rev_8_21_14_0_10_49_10]
MEPHHTFSIVPPIVFGLTFVGIIFEKYEKSLLALLSAAVLIVAGYVTPEEAIEAINFETIILLMSMMMLVEIAKQSGIFSWLNVRLVASTKGNPLAIYLVFSLLTAVLSAFLDNVTTILIVIPITIELFRGLGQNPKKIILAEIFMSNIGGTLTLIGDPPNIIIGGATGFSFNAFIENLWIPVLISITLILSITVMQNWKDVKPIKHNCTKLLLSMMLLRRLRYRFVRMDLSTAFIVKVLSIMSLTILGFMLNSFHHVPAHIVALLGSTLLALLCTQNICIHKVLQTVEWTTLLFFAGLFVLVAGVEHTGILTNISLFIVNSTNNFALILLLVLWVSGIVSMILDNIPFVTVMIPVIVGIQGNLAGQPHLDLLWWALALGTCIGGNGTMIGASANVIGVDLANKEGVHISFLSYTKTALPLTLLALSISSAYILIRYFST